MNKAPDPQRSEAGRKGGIASGEARRKRRARRWEDAYLDAVDSDPAGFAAKLLASSNAMVQVKALEIALGARKAALATREEELKQRAQELADRERPAESSIRWGELASPSRL